MRSVSVIPLLALLAIFPAACGKHGGTTSSGAFEVALTDERLQTVQGNSCAVRGHATNVGNVRSRVELTYEARNASGAVIATSTASFEVAPFSDNDFTTSAFDGGVACSGISSFRRSRTNITAA
jgi:hypothetical protein